MNWLDPVDKRHPGLDPPRHEEPERDGRVEVAARDVPERRDHDREDQTVGERDAEEVVAKDDRAGADERKCPRAERLRDPAPNNVPLVHGLKA